MAGSGSSTSTLAFGGSPSSALTESWNGTSWTEVADLATGRENLGGAGTSTLGLAYGGSATLTATEEWSTASPLSLAVEGQVWYNTTSNTMKAYGYTLGTGAWASGGTLPSKRGNYGACGTQSATVSGGGYDGGPPEQILNNTILYDGTSWSSGNNMNMVKDHNFMFGIQTAAVSVGGILSPGGAHQSVVEEYDGTNWTEVTNVPTTMVGGGTAGSLTAGLIMGGSTGTTPAGAATSFEYDGTNWTAGGALNTGRYRAMGQCIGLQTAALYAGGFEGPAPGSQVEEYDGSTWTIVGAFNTAADLGGGAGITTSAIKISGRNGPPSYTTIGNVETYDGTSWTEVADVSSARSYCSATGSGAGTVGNTTALFFGGATTSSTPNTTATEEWNIPTSYTIKTFTAS